MTSSSTILFAGGGTGGHIFPSLAIAERLRERQSPLQVHFAVSNRPLDAQVLTRENTPFTPLVARPFSSRPWHWPGFFRAAAASTAQVTHLIRELHVTAVVAMGGFVSAPALVAARRAGIPGVLVNLDAVPGQANRHMVSRATEVFSVYPSPVLPGAHIIGLPLRRSAVGPDSMAAARRELGLDPERETLLITGASQGAESINHLMIRLVNLAQAQKALRTWQVLHLAGAKEVDVVRAAYAKAEVPARVEAFCHTMGLAWRSADLAVSRAGAGSVAEVWANATPTIFLPYPYQKDQHQRLNAEPLLRLGAAQVLRDLAEPQANARQLTGPLLGLMGNAQQRLHMGAVMRQHMPPDGAAVVADWLLKMAG